MENIEVSVIIPTYNRKNTLKRAIDSVLNQTYKNFEIIIVDDCSTDGTLEYITELYGALENLIYIRNDKNLGPSASRNVGALHASGTYLAFQDSDDEWLPHKLERQMEALKNVDEEPGFVYSAFKAIDSKGEETFFPMQDVDNEWKTGRNAFICMLTVPLVCTITLLIKKELFLAEGGFNEELRALVDYELALRISHTRPVLFMDEVLAIHHNSAVCVGTDDDNQVKAHCYLMNKYQKELEEYGLKRAKFFIIFDNCRKRGKAQEFLKYVAYNFQDAEYREYIKEALKQLEEG